MFRNYIKIALRNLLKNKVYSGINLLGLATGMAVTLLIGLWVWDEVTFNHNFQNYDRIAKVMTTQTFNGHTGTNHAVSMPLGIELRNKYTSDFKYVTLASWNFGNILSVGDKKLANTGMWVQPEFTEMFSCQMLSGDIHALKDPSSILLAKSLAKSLFGESDPMGKTVKLNNRHDFTVAGVFEDFPFNSSFEDTRYLLPWDKYISTEDWLKESQTQWMNHSFQLYVQLNEGVNVERSSQKISTIARKHVNEGDEYAVLQPMKNWHLYSEFKDGKVVGGRIQFVWMFGIIGFFVLLLACINFMNLSTARSEKRAKEVGIRKAIGSLRGQLIGQFLSESLVVTFLALFLALLLVWLALPYFNSLSHKQMSMPWVNPVFWLVAIGFTVFTGLISGSYPAFYLSGFQPIHTLKGTFRVGKWAGTPRKVLVVVQFTVSVVLIIGTAIVYKQIQHGKNRPVGYTREGLITMDMTTPEIFGKYNALRDDLLKTGVLVNMCESNSPTTDIWSNQIGFTWEGKDPKLVPLLGVVAVTHDFGKTIGWQLKLGRDFSRDFPADTGALILNESAVKLMGFKDPIGQRITWNDKTRPVIGVVKDVIMRSPYEEMTPTVFFLEYNWSSTITMRIKPTIPILEALAKIEPVFKNYNPSSPFDYRFTDEQYAKKFSDEERIGNLASVFAILAIFISCLGLFGLASFVAEQRTKEIGVRKVLGATIFNLWTMLSRDFVLLVLISCGLAIPIAWYFLSGWLEKYEYRTEINWWIFALSAMGALVITLATVSFQAIKAALANPVKSLRTE